MEKYGEEGTASRKHGTFPRNGRAGRVVGTRRCERDERGGESSSETRTRVAEEREREILMRVEAVASRIERKMV